MSDDKIQGSESERDPAPAHRDVPRWISVEEMLPPLKERVLFCCYPDEVTGCGNVYVGGFHGLKTRGKAVAMEYSCDDGDWLPCTHWMPLPEPPKFPV